MLSGEADPPGKLSLRRVAPESLPVNTGTTLSHAKLSSDEWAALLGDNFHRTALKSRQQVEFDARLDRLRALA
jgi:hypothetical protein